MVGCRCWTQYSVCRPALTIGPGGPKFPPTGKVILAVESHFHSLTLTLVSAVRCTMTVVALGTVIKDGPLTRFPVCSSPGLDRSPAKSSIDQSFWICADPMISSIVTALFVQIGDGKARYGFQVQGPKVMGKDFRGLARARAYLAWDGIYSPRLSTMKSGDTLQRCLTLMKKSTE